MLNLSFSIEGETQLLRRFQKLDEGLKDWTPEFRQTGEYLQGFFSNEVFNSEGSVFSEQWKPLSPQYAAWKEKRFPGEGILVRTGKMQSSFEYDAGKMQVRVFNNTPYFKYHQSNQPRTKLPRRIMMKLDEDRKQWIVQLFRRGAQRVIDSEFKSAGYGL